MALYGIRPIVAHAVADTKRQLIEAAKSDRADRLQLDRIIAELLRAAPQPAEGRRIDRLIGGWRRFWTDDASPPSSLGQPDPCYVYQVVNDGFYHDVMRVRSDDADHMIVRRATYRVGARGLAIRITDNFCEAGWPPESTDLCQLVPRFEITRHVAPADTGHVVLGQPEQQLRNVYVDDDLRIAYVRQTNGSSTALQIMERTARIGGANA